MFHGKEYVYEVYKEKVSRGRRKTFISASRR